MWIIVGIIVGIPLLFVVGLYVLWLCIPAAFTVYEQLTGWFGGPFTLSVGEDYLDTRYNIWWDSIKTVLTWIFGFPGTLVGIAIWILFNIPRWIFGLIKWFFGLFFK